MRKLSEQLQAAVALLGRKGLQFEQKHVLLYLLQLLLHLPLVLTVAIPFFNDDDAEQQNPSKRIAPILVSYRLIEPSIL
jgi:hypothetical protein